MSSGSGASSTASQSGGAPGGSPSPPQPAPGSWISSVLLLFCFNQPLMPVDRHVERVAKRIGLLPEKAIPDLAHDQFIAMLADEPELSYETHVLLIHHGRAICQARSPKHDLCPIRGRCRMVDPKAP